MSDQTKVDTFIEALEKYNHLVAELRMGMYAEITELGNKSRRFVSSSGVIICILPPTYTDPTTKIWES